MMYTPKMFLRFALVSVCLLATGVNSSALRVSTSESTKKKATIGLGQALGKAFNALLRKKTEAETQKQTKVEEIPLKSEDSDEYPDNSILGLNNIMEEPLREELEEYQAALEKEEQKEREARDELEKQKKKRQQTKLDSELKRQAIQDACNARRAIKEIWGHLKHFKHDGLSITIKNKTFNIVEETEKAAKWILNTNIYEEFTRMSRYNCAKLVRDLLQQNHNLYPASIHSAASTLVEILDKHMFVSNSKADILMFDEHLTTLSRTKSNFKDLQNKFTAHLNAQKNAQKKKRMQMMMLAALTTKKKKRRMEMMKLTALKKSTNPKRNSTDNK